VLRTVAVVIAGMLLGFVVGGGLIWVGMHLPLEVRRYAYYLIDVLTGVAVGLLVGFLQRHKAGLVALICLSPQVFLQYVNRYSRPATGLRMLLLLIGTVLELSTAFAIADRLSKATKRATGIQGPVRRPEI
jgi:hypothetical protein